MKKYFLLIAFLFKLCSLPVHPQSQQIKYVRLDQIKKQTRSLLSKNAVIEFNLFSLQNLMNDSIIYGVEVNLNTVEKELVGTSIAVANFADLWGGSVGATINYIQEEGYKVLNHEDLGTIKTFMNKALQIRGVRSENFAIYKLTLSDKIQIGFKYDPAIKMEDFSQNFEFIITVEDAVYITSYDVGMEIMQKLSNYQDRLIELQSF